MVFEKLSKAGVHAEWAGVQAVLAGVHPHSTQLLFRPKFSGVLYTKKIIVFNKRVTGGGVEGFMNFVYCLSYPVT